MENNVPLAARCIHCKKQRGVHKACTFECPTGMKTRIGYISFHPTQVFELDPKWKPSKDAPSFTL